MSLSLLGTADIMSSGCPSVYVSRTFVNAIFYKMEEFHHVYNLHVLGDQRCLRRILGIHWHDFVRNADIRHMTNRPPLSSIVNSRRLSFFRHLVRMDENADDSQVILSLFQRAGDVHLGGHVLPG